MRLREAFGQALKRVRHKLHLTQDDFSLTAARSYMGLLERGGTSPTLDKIDALSEQLNIHPVTLLSLSYAMRDGVEIGHVVARVRSESELLALDDDAPQPKRRPKRQVSPR